MAQGREHGIRNAGYRAIESLRLEKAYCAWGAELTPDHTPLEAGLSWTVKLDTGRDFIGRSALLRQRESPLGKRLAGFTVDDDDVVLLGRETIYRDGARVGWLTSAGYGYTVRKSIGLGYVRSREGVTREFLAAGRYELEVATRRVPCRIELAPLYDPHATRMRS
jgi:4-methylaminobutanoate oxidase (formaldehyde-forming)